MNRESLIRLKDSSLNLAQELAARMNGDEPPTSDEFAWCGLYLQMHKAAVMELHFFTSRETSSKTNDLFFAIEHLHEHAEQHPEDKAIVYPFIDVLRKLETLANSVDN